MKSKRVVMLISLMLMLVVNILANALPINNLTTGEISDQFPNLFVPAGYVFSIWGLIYLALIAFTIYSFTPKGLANPDIDHIAWWFVAANLFNTAWILHWHYLQFPMTLVAIFGLLISLVMIYLMLGIGVKQRSLDERLLVNLPFSIYLGWVTVAVVANVTQVLYSTGWRGAPLSEPAWAVIMLLVASGLGVLMIIKRKELAYALVLAWAFIGIWVKQADIPTVAMTALIAAIALIALALGFRITAKARRP